MKELPKHLSKEIFLKIDYLICRFMQNKFAYKIDQSQSGTLFTIKKIKEKNLPKQYQFHIRFNGEDKWNNKADVIDFDFYIPENELYKIILLLEEKKEVENEEMPKLQQLSDFKI